YDLGAVTADDIVLVGDSFVWGYGVDKDEAFGFRLQALYQAEGRPTKVYSLGVGGWDPPEYVECLARGPRDVRGRRGVLSYYMNEMPFKDLSLWDCRFQAIHILGVGSPLMQLLGDVNDNVPSPFIDTYHRFLVERYDPADPTFRSRWEQLEGYASRFRELA